MTHPDIGEARAAYLAGYEHPSLAEVEEEVAIAAAEHGIPDVDTEEWREKRLEEMLGIA